MRWSALLVLQVAVSGSAMGAGSAIDLPPHPERVGVDVATALERRRSTREYAERELTPEDLSALLWAGNGVNRSDGKRTAPTAHGQQYVDVYVISHRGAYRYDAVGNRLELVREGDFKGRISGQSFVGKASHVLVFVADLGKLTGPAGEAETHPGWANATAGAIAQNVALMAAGKGIGACVVAGFDHDFVSELLGLSGAQEPLYVMPVGYPR